MPPPEPGGIRWKLPPLEGFNGLLSSCDYATNVGLSGDVALTVAARIALHADVEVGPDIETSVD